MDINIIEIYKSANSKLEVIDRLARETGKTVPEIFVELSEAKCCDGRFFRQGRYAKEWNEAKKIIKENNLKRAAEATTSFSDLKKENEQLRKDCENLQKQLENEKNSHDDANNADIPESYQKTIDAQRIEIQSLNEVIEDQQKSYQEAYQQMKDENDSANALIEDLRNVVQLREDEVKELKEVIEKKEASIQHLLSENADLKKSLDHHKVSDFNATADGMVLESKLKTAEEKNAKLLERIRGLEEENEELRCTNCAEDIRKQLTETTGNYNDAMIMNKKLEGQIELLEEEKESDGLIIADHLQKISELENKLAKAEEYVLKQVLYGEMS